LQEKVKREQFKYSTVDVDFEGIDGVEVKNKRNTVNIDKIDLSFESPSAPTAEPVEMKIKEKEEKTPEK
jgi:hypothetical protein